MGIRGLYSYVNKVPGSWKTINIIEELENYERKTGKRPVLIMNLWTLAYHWQQDIKDAIVGFRMNVIEETFSSFLEKLQHAGAVMVFVFKKSQVRESDFISGKAEDYAKGKAIVELMRSTSDLNKLESFCQFKYPTERLPLNHAVMHVLAQVSKRFGKLHGMDTINKRSSTFQVQLANQYNAMAIVGLDTYYSFYEGSWTFWSDKDLDMESMTIRQYNKEKIMEHLNLTPEKTPLFITLAGGLYSTEENIRKVVSFFRPGSQDFFKVVAEFVNQYRFPLMSGSLILLITRIFDNCPQKVFDDFKLTMNVMNTKDNTNVVSKVDSEIMNLVKDDFANLAEEILENSPILISPVYLDLSEISNLHDIITPFIQKSCGILLKHQADRDTRTVLVKKSDRESFQEIKIAPIYPSFAVPQLKMLLTGRLSYEDKLRMLLWISGLELKVLDLKYIPSEILVSTISLLCLIQAKSMNIAEAGCMIKSIVDVNRSPIEYPKRINARAFQLSFLHSKIFFYLTACNVAVGLRDFENDLKFDGARFQLLYASEDFNQPAERVPVEMIEHLKELLKVINR